MRLRWIGHRMIADVSIVVEPDLGLTDAHDIAHDAQARLVGAIPRLAGATIHVSPASGSNAS